MRDVRRHVRRAERPAPAHQDSRQAAVPVQAVRPYLRPEGHPAGPHEQARGRQEVQLRQVRQNLHAAGKFDPACEEYSPQREGLPVQLLRQAVCLQEQPRGARADPHHGEELCVRAVPASVQNRGAAEAPPDRPALSGRAEWHGGRRLR
uniref:(northern house mosquito) hypothetical protein n=1 Tax=Culex pipiens TaxID=7175 RepID=A0A8D8JHR4_CULPI